MELRVTSIKEAKRNLKDLNLSNIKAIIISSYNDDIETISNENKLLIEFDDLNYQSQNSFNKNLAQKIKRFIDKIDFDKNKLYVCCDSGESRSSAVAACILRKYGEKENVIWKDACYHPNIFVYSILCKELGLKNSKIRLKYKTFINNKALQKKIKSAKKIK
ncbi:MAG: hypothetical protein ACI4ON_04600 [Clostridia bacterium]